MTPRLAASVVRGVALLIWAVIVSLTPYTRLVSLPATIRNELVLGRFFALLASVLPDFDATSALTVLQWTTVCSCVVLVLFPRRLWLLTPVVCLSVAFLESLVKSAGAYANHAQVVPFLTLMIVGIFCDGPFLSPLEKPVAPEQARASHEPVVVLTAATLTLCYTLIGTNRLFLGGLEVFRGDAIVDYIRTMSRQYSAFGLSLGSIIIEVPTVAVMAKVGFAVVTVFECLSFLALISRRFRLAWVTVVTAFHCVAFLTMNILFWENELLIVASIAFGLTVSERRPLERKLASAQVQVPPSGATTSPLANGRLRE